MEPTWGRLGTSGTSSAALRVSWARLGRVSGASSGRLGGVLALGVVLRPFLKHFGTILGPFWDHFGIVLQWFSTFLGIVFFINFVKVFFCLEPFR